MLPEKVFKKHLLDRLNKINPGWIDGDFQNNHIKTVDLINLNLKIGIEIKDDTVFKYSSSPSVYTINHDKVSNQFKTDARDANTKFKNYPDFRTVLLMRTELVNLPLSIVGYQFSGLRRFTKSKSGLNNIEIGRKNKYLSFTSTKEIGCYLLFGNNQYYFIGNPNANPKRNFNKKILEFVFSEKIEEIKLET